MMFEIRFNRKLNTLVDGFHDYRMRVYHLIERTEAEGWTDELVIAAHQERPRNTALQSWLQKYEAKKVTPETQQTTTTSPEIGEPPQDGQAMTAEQERQKQQNTNASPNPGMQKGQESRQTPPDQQLLENVPPPPLSLSTQRGDVDEDASQTILYKLINSPPDVFDAVIAYYDPPSGVAETGTKANKARDLVNTARAKGDLQKLIDDYHLALGKRPLEKKFNKD